MRAGTARVSARIVACAALVLASTGMAIVALSAPSGAKPPKPKIALVKTASISSFVGPGTAVTYSYKVTNTGNVTLGSVGVTDPMPGLSAISCPTTTLAAEASETCTATYTTTQADFDTGSITNTGTATGTPPHGSVVTATSSVTVPQLGMTPSTCADDKAQGCIATLPCSTGTCPTVDVSPNTDLRDGQNVSIKVTDFPSTDSFRVALCSGITSATDPSCLAGMWENTSYSPISIPVDDNAAQQNLTSATYPVFFDPSGEDNSLIPALDILQNNHMPGFNCDDTVDPCDIVVTDEAGQGPVVGFGPPVDATNSVIIPLTFRALEAGCPANTPALNTDSSTSVEQLIPTVVDSTCNGPNGVVALNTTDDNASAVADFASGGAAVAFIDNPMDPTEMAPLKGEAYALVPVAVSASTVSFLAGDILNGLSVPISTYNLTPDMVAGLINSAYESPEGNPTYIYPGGVQTDDFADSDNLTSALATSGVTCTMLYNCPTSNQLDWLADNLDAFDLVNPLSADSVSKDGVTPQSFGSFMSDVPSGASYETTDWLCRAPNPALTVTVFEPDQSGDPVATQVSVDDPNSAATTFTTVPQSSVWPPPGDAHAPWVFPSCAGISEFPSISGTSSQFSSAQSPALQAYKIRGYAYGGGEVPLPQNGSDPLAAFGIMDSSEASFWGLGEASLENASGNFVAPTTASVEAGLAAAQPCTTVSPTCPANTYQFNWSDPDPTAYPMPDITYAIVPTAGVSAATTTAISNLVTNMINFSTSQTLPAGYFPMPAGMAKAALAALHTALYASPASPANSGRSSSLSSVFTIPESSVSPAVAPSTIAKTSLSSSTTAGAQVTTKGGPSSSSAKRAPKARSRPPVIPVDLSVIFLGTAGRFLLPSALVVALLCFVGGLLILRRARSKREHEVAGEIS